MRVYIYNNLLKNPEVTEFYNDVSAHHGLQQHLLWFYDLVAFLKKYETNDPNNADYFFIPIFLVAFQFMNVDPISFINECRYVSYGRHILFASGDFGQRKKSIYESHAPGRAYADLYTWLDSRFVLIALESTDDLLEQDLAIFPYQSLEFNTECVRRDYLYSFVGQLKYSQLPNDHIRGGVLNKITEQPDSFIGSQEKADQVFGEKYTDRFMFARSVFTLCPAGFGRWSFRYIEALLSGSIPVIISNGYKLPFRSYLEWEKYCIICPEEDIESLDHYLRNISCGAVLELQNNIEQDKHMFTREGCFDFLQKTLEKLADDNCDYGYRKMSSADKAVEKMRGPSKMGIICIDVTNRCDLHCSNCTRLLENQDRFWDMTPENFRLALRSLKEYKGIIGMIGGNPCLHPQFKELCSIFIEEITDKDQRGLWTNNVFKYDELVAEVFGGFNLNPHGDERCIKSLKPLYEKLRTGNYYSDHSFHSPLLTAVKDIYQDDEMWEKIANCDINKEWSASIVQNDGELRVYFCEVAASFDLARKTDHGIKLVESWWKKPLSEFKQQILHFCPGCGVPARLIGELDCNACDTYTKSNIDLVNISLQKKRKVKELDPKKPLDIQNNKVTQYTESQR